MKTPDWTRIRSFLAVAETGSLVAAADRLGVSQPSVGRHIDHLERETGLTLFVRGRTGMRLTESGLALVDDARTMGLGADRFALKVAGHRSHLDGVVRITASTVVATYILPAIIGKLSHNEPEIEIELVASNAVENLLSRDADIAVRMVRPTQDDLIARKVNDMTMGVFAHDAYLARHGTPRTWADLLNHRLIGYDRSDLILRALSALGIETGRRNFQIRTDDQVANWELVKAAAGIGFGSVYIAGLSPNLRQLTTDLAVPSLPVWLVSHQDLRTSLRIRRVMDFLGEALSRLPLTASSDRQVD